MYALDFASKLFRDDETIKQRIKLKINELLNKYGESREAITQNANLADSIDYMFAHGDMLIDEVLEERKLIRSGRSATSKLQNVARAIKDVATIAADTIQYTPEAIGELAADIQIAKNYYDKMNVAGKKLVNTYGTGQGADIDNYYHPLLQCELAKISPISRDYGLRLGYAKEIWDYHRKKGKMSSREISQDSIKDLQNNLYGSNLGYSNPNMSCEELLDDRRTPNMRKKNLR